MNNLYKWGASACLALSTLSVLQAQTVGIGTNTPDNSAKLHIVDNNRGLLIPQVSIPNINNAAPVTAPALACWSGTTTPLLLVGVAVAFTTGTEHNGNAFRLAIVRMIKI